MSHKRKSEINFTEGPYLSKIIRFALPIMATGILQILFNAVDSMVVGRFVGDGALAAVTSTGPLINLIVNLFMGISVGSNVLVAQYYGARREKDIFEVVHTSVILSVGLGVVVMLVGFFFSKTFLHWMNSPDDVIDLASLYLKIYFLGAPVSLLYNFCAAMLRAIGDTRRPLAFLTVGGLLNVFLNLFCVLVLHLGVAGVAIGTIASQLVSALLIVMSMLKEKGPVRIEARGLKVYWTKLKSILRIGVPAGIQSVMFSISNVIIQTALNGFGKIVMAGNGAATQIENFNYMAMQSVCHASLNFVGQNIGAKKYDRVRKGVLICLGLVSVIGIALGIGSYLLGDILLGFYTTSKESIQVGMVKLLYAGLPYFIFGIMDTLGGAVRGLGASLTPMITTVIGTCVLRIVWVMTVFHSIGTLESLYIVYPVSWASTAVVHLISFFILFRRMRRRLDSIPKKKHVSGGETVS